MVEILHLSYAISSNSLAHATKEEIERRAKLIAKDLGLEWDWLIEATFSFNWLCE